MTVTSFPNTGVGVQSNARYKSPLRYPGGKQKAIKSIAKMLPAKCLEFREPMVGGGSVFLYTKSIELAQKYWINDQFEELVAFWQILQDEKTCSRLRRELEELRSQFKSPIEIQDFFLTARKEQRHDKFEMAFLFFFFNRVTFSGTTRAGGFSKAASQARFTASSIDRLAPLPEALKDVVITNLDYADVVNAPGEDVFLFLDPPYYKASKLYGRNGDLHKFDHERLANILEKSKHKFLITYDDCEEVHELYPWANIVPWKLQYGMNNCGKDGLSKLGSELFISNYELPSSL